MPIVQDDWNLLDAMMADAERVEDPAWQLGPYWRPYAQSIAKAIRMYGLKGFRSNAAIIKGYGDTHYLDPPVWAKSLKQRLCRLLMRMPLLSIIDEHYQGLVHSARNRRDIYYRMSYRLLYKALEVAEGVGGTMNLVRDSLAGYPKHMTIDDIPVTRKGLELFLYLRLLAIHADMEQIKSVVEIGAGYGCLCELFHRLAPKLSRYIIVDIPPIAYVSTQYLRACLGDRVLDYRWAADREYITDSDIADHILVIPPWLVPRLDITADLLWNSESFQEMTPETVSQYLDSFRHVSAVFSIQAVEGSERHVAEKPFEWVAQELASRGFHLKEPVRGDPWWPALYQGVRPGSAYGYFEHKA